MTSSSLSSNSRQQYLSQQYPPSPLSYCDCLHGLARADLALWAPPGKPGKRFWALLLKGQKGGGKVRSFSPVLLPHVIGQVRYGRGRKGKHECWKQSLGLHWQVRGSSGQERGGHPARALQETAAAGQREGRGGGEVLQGDPFKRQHKQTTKTITKTNIPRQHTEHNN